MVLVGDPAPIAIMRLRQRVGTGGVGRKYRIRSKMFFMS